MERSSCFPGNENLDPDEEVVLRLRCYEPAGQEFGMGGDQLCRHTLVAGMTGSGKSSLLNEMLFQAVAYASGEEERKPGLVVFDFKGDDAAGFVTAVAAEHGREEDVCVLEPGGPWRLDLFGDLGGIGEVERAVDRWMAANPPGDLQNAYWEHAMRKRLNHAFTILRATCEGPIRSGEGLGFLRDWLLGQERGSLPDRVEQFRKLVGRAAPRLPEDMLAYFRTVEAGIEEWRLLDPRTRSNEISSLSNLLQPLLGLEAQEYWAGEERPVLSLKEVVTKGRIVVVSLPAVTSPGLASVIGGLVKARLYTALHRRRIRAGIQDRLVGIFIDEWPLLATGGSGLLSDLTQLQTLRSKRAFIVAATQGFGALEERLGKAGLENALASFGSAVLFRSSESSVARFGWRRWRRPAPCPSPGEDFWKADEPARRVGELVGESTVVSMPPEALESLPVGHAWVALVERPPHPAKVWLAGRCWQPAHDSAEDEVHSLARRIDAAWSAALSEERDVALLESNPPPRDASAVPGEASESEEIIDPRWLWGRLAAERAGEPDPDPGALAAAEPARFLPKAVVRCLKRRLLQAGWGRPSGVETLPRSWARGLLILIRAEAGFAHPPAELHFLGCAGGRLLLACGLAEEDPRWEAIRSFHHHLEARLRREQPRGRAKR